MLFYIWLLPRYKLPEFFHNCTRPHLHFGGAAIRGLYIGLRVCYKYYKNIVVLVWPGAAHTPIAA